VIKQGPSSLLSGQGSFYAESKILKEQDTGWKDELEDKKKKSREQLCVQGQWSIISHCCRKSWK